MPKDHGIGASSKRREDVRFLSGRGRYTDDMNLARQAYAVFLRAQVAHAKINKIDTTDAAAMPGVIRVFTAQDFSGVGGLPCGWQVTDRHGEPMQEPPHPILAQLLHNRGIGSAPQGGKRCDRKYSGQRLQGRSLPGQPQGRDHSWPRGYPRVFPSCRRRRFPCRSS